MAEAFVDDRLMLIATSGGSQPTEEKNESSTDRRQQTEDYPTSRWDNPPEVLGSGTFVRPDEVVSGFTDA